MQGIAEARQQEQRALATHLHPGPRLRGAARGHPRLAGGLPPGLRCARVVALTWSGCGSGRGARGARGGLLGACPDCGAPSPRPRRQAPSRRRPHCSGGVAGAAGLGAAGAGEYARPADPRPRAPRTLPRLRCHALASTPPTSAPGTPAVPTAPGRLAPASGSRVRPPTLRPSSLGPWGYPPGRAPGSKEWPQAHTRVIRPLPQRLSRVMGAPCRDPVGEKLIGSGGGGPEEGLGTGPDLGSAAGKCGTPA